MQRIFISSDQLNNDSVLLDSDTFHHIFNVKRIKVNDEIEMVIDQKRLIKVSIMSVRSFEFNYKIIDQWAINPRRTTPISLIQALPKKDKFNDICRMCTELGVKTISPVVSEFCDTRFLSENKLARAKKTIKSAAMQSHQYHVPTLSPILPLSELLRQLDSPKGTLKLVAYEHSTSQLNNLITSLPTEIIVAIGPEGGFSQNDISILKAFDFIPFSLGDHILRTEHAGFASICYLDGFFDSLKK